MTPTPSEREARELLAREYERVNRQEAANNTRKGSYGWNDSDRACAIRVIAALTREQREGDDSELPGMWSRTDFTGGDPDERSYADRNKPQQEAPEVGNGHHPFCNYRTKPKYSPGCICARMEQQEAPGERTQCPKCDCWFQPPGTPKTLPDGSLLKSMTVPAEAPMAVAIVPKHSQMEAAVDAYLAEQEQGGSLHDCVFEACDAFVKATPPAPVPAGSDGAVAFVVKHYIGDDGPSIKGNGFDGLRVGEDRQEAQEFVDWVNARITPPAPVDVRGLRAPLEVFSAGEWRYSETGQTFTAADLDEAAFVAYRALLDGQQAGVDAAIKSVREAELFADGVEGDLHCMGVTTIAAAYMEGRQQALNELQAALGGGGRDDA